MYVKKNDTLLVFDQKWINKENEILTASKSLNENYLQDLKLLINNKKTGFTSDKYISEYEVYISGLKERETQKDRINKDLKRALSLYSDSLISEKEYEDIEQEYLALENTIHSYRSSQILKWKSESESYKNELLAISDRINKLKELSSQSVIISPVNGIIHEMKGLTSGTYINLHQHICNISPDTAYYAEVLINPPDIGWIYTGLKGRILLDSYGSNYWEAIETECIFISEEFSLFGDRPFFIARCSIDRFKPITRNGYYETIKKGMTLTVQFIITERTIFQLLTDKIDKWISLKNGIK